MVEIVVGAQFETKLQFDEILNVCRKYTGVHFGGIILVFGHIEVNPHNGVILILGHNSLEPRRTNKLFKELKIGKQFKKVGNSIYSY
jgi:hypothetical protein